jgi:hypothetical protein
VCLSSHAYLDYRVVGYDTVAYTHILEEPVACLSSCQQVSLKCW